MLEIYEKTDGSKKLIRSMQGEIATLSSITGYTIILGINVESKEIVEVIISPHQLGRLGKYLTGRSWQGGLICPMNSIPSHCYITELDDNAEYIRVLTSMDYHNNEVNKYDGISSVTTELSRKWHSKEIKRLTLEALKLKGSNLFGLRLLFPWSKPEVTIDWVPNDPKVVAGNMLETAKLAYDTRDSLPGLETNLTEWKRNLFEV